MSDEGTGKDAEPDSTGPATTPDSAADSAAPTTDTSEKSADTSDADASKKASDEPSDAADATSDAPGAPANAPDAPAPTAAAQPLRGPRLVPGAAVAGGRYRLISHCGQSRGLQFWHARDINLDRDVALTFVDAEQLAEPTAAGEAPSAQGEGPQAVLTRTLRIGGLHSAGAARVLDVIRGSSGGIVVSEWVTGSSLAEVAATSPSPIGAARAVRALAAAAEAAHRTGGALSIDSPARIRVSTNGDAVLAFPGTLAGDDRASDVRGLGAVLYALLLDRWPLTADGSRTTTEKQASERVGGMPPAMADDTGDTPIEPRQARSVVPFEISAVASRALAGNQGIRTAATVQHVLDQATVLDLPTDMMPPVDSDGKPIAPPPGQRAASPVATAGNNSERNMPLLIGLGVAAMLLVIALVIMLAKFFGGSSGPGTDIDAILTATSGASSSAPGATISLQNVSVVDFSDQPADPSTNVANVISGASPAWHTDNYRFSSNFGGLKPGVGLLFNLGGPQTVKSVTIATPNPGFTVELRTAQSGASDLASTTKVGGGQVESAETTLNTTGAKPSTFLLVWITDLAPSQTTYGQYEATISKITMRG